MKRVLILNAILYTPENGRKLETISDSLMVTVCKGFLAAGYKPTLIADSYYKPLEIEDYGFEIIYFDHSLEKLFSPYKMPFPKGLRKYLKQYKDEYDFIISSEVFSWYSFIAACVAKEKLIVWHELALHNKILAGYASRIWYELVGRAVFGDVLIAPRSEKARCFISQYCNNVDSKIYQHPIDTDAFTICSAKEKLNYFISVSQLVQRKQVNKIIEMFSKFHLTHQDFELCICGDGEEKNVLMDLVNKLGISDVVFFKGMIKHDELAELLKRAKALLIYTNKDNSILTISEAIASGTPILTTSIPDNSDFVIKTNTGIVKDDWAEVDLERIIIRNSEYIDNCSLARNELTNISLAKKFIKLSERLKTGKGW